MSAATAADTHRAFTMAWNRRSLWAEYAPGYIVAPYRAAQNIAARDERDEADTEGLRQAIVHYRTLFDQLLEIEEPKVLNVPAAQIPCTHEHEYEEPGATEATDCSRFPRPRQGDTSRDHSKRDSLDLSHENRSRGVREKETELLPLFAEDVKMWRTSFVPAGISYRKALLMTRGSPSATEIPSSSKSSKASQKRFPMSVLHWKVN